MKKVIIYTFGISALYLVVANATGFGKALTSAGNVYVKGVRTLQGR